jgi:hypothetical protein
MIQFKPQKTEKTSKTMTLRQHFSRYRNMTASFEDMNVISKYTD